MMPTRMKYLWAVLFFTLWNQISLQLSNFNFKLNLYESFFEEKKYSETLIKTIQSVFKKSLNNNEIVSFFLIKLFFIL